MSTRRYVVVGGGTSGGSAAHHLRQSGFDGRIVLVGDEPVAPYERPPLSKDFLTGKAETSDLALHDPGWAAEQDIELRLGVRADSLDVGGRTVLLDTGERLSYDALVLATGVRPRRLPGLAGERVHYLRDAAGAARLRAQLAEAARIVVVGAGFIGCEVAAAAIALGKAVTVFEPEPTPLRRALGTRIGSVLVGIHRARGVDVRLGDRLGQVTETAGGLIVTSELGHRLECDLIVVGVGCEPNTELAADAGIAVEGGVLTDEYGRTSAPGVYAAGDLVSQYHPHYGRRIRVEHHDTAIRQGRNVAANLTGARQPFVDAHWFWSDQYEHSLQCAGRPVDLDDLVVRGSLEDRQFSAFSLVDGRVRGVISLNRPRDVLDVRRLLFTEHAVTAEQLADESVPVKRLVPRGTSR
jgi:3-phenylpropionate/trans-cinnamate dioxygenase ferredoxin reductase subunit